MKQLYDRSPRRRRARARSFGWIVTRLAWMAAKLVSSKSETRYASAASWRAMTADDWNRKAVYEGVISMFKLCEDVKETNLEVLSDFTNETLEGELADEQLGGLLVPSDLTKGDSTGPETMRLLDSTSCSLFIMGVIYRTPRSHHKIHTAAVLRADLAASCLRGALPEEKCQTYNEEPVNATNLQ